MPTLCRNVAKQLSCHASYCGGTESSVLIQLHLIPSTIPLHSCILFISWTQCRFLKTGSLWLSFTSKFRALSTRLKTLRYLYPCGGPPSTSQEPELWHASPQFRKTTNSMSVQEIQLRWCFFGKTKFIIIMPHGKGREDNRTERELNLRKEAHGSSVWKRTVWNAEFLLKTVYTTINYQKNKAAFSSSK
jgi:hypothetical protein